MKTAHRTVREDSVTSRAPSEAALSASIAEANAHVAAGRYGNALAIIRRGLAASPHDVDLLLAQAATLFAWGRFRDVCGSCPHAEAVRSGNVPLFVTLGWSWIAIGSPGEAEAWMRRATDIEPADWKAHFGLGAALRQLNRLEEAIVAYERALALEPDNFECLINLVFCRLEQGDLAAAEAQARRAIARDSLRAVAWEDLGMALARQDRHAEAAGAFERAMQLEAREGSDGGSFVNAANNLRDGDKLPAALALYEENLAQRPSHHGHNEYALGLLTAGRLSEGWDHYEFRWMRNPLLPLRPGFRKPVWAGQDLRGRTILLRAEQGIGDTIQFMRYAPYVKALGAKVLLKVQDGFGSLAARFPGVDAVIGRTEALPSFDFYIHLLSLPRVFGTDLASIPAEVPYLQPDPAQVERWALRLGTPGGRLKIGLVWAGSEAHSRDRHRSMPPSSLAPLGQLAGARYFGLQKGSQAAAVEGSPINAEFVNLGPELQDFGDTAALIAHLDLVLCVDTAVAHLAGAQGKPVWLMLPRPADFRWMEEREDSPWYPTMRLFRQSRPGDWDGVVERVRSALEPYLRDGGIEDRRCASPPVTPAPLRPRPMPLARLSPGHKPAFSAVAETRVGIVQYFPDQPLVGDSIGWYGEYLQPQLDLLARLIRPGASLMEVGEGVGVHALFLAALVGPSGHLFLYEPRPLMQRVLRQNLAANRVGNVTLMKRALGPAAEASAAETPTESLDELQLDQLQLLKIDNDADALDVLAGGAETLWRLRPLLFIAARDDASLRAVASRVRELSYRCWRMETAWFSTTNFNRREADIFSGRAALALLAIPEEIEVDIALDGCVELS